MRNCIIASLKQRYKMCTLILEFFIFSIAGWGWEVLLYGYQHHAFINRGVLHGPWLPIYGGGSMLILILLGGLRKRPVKLFLITMVLCGVIEYVTAAFLEMAFHEAWWDYSNMLFQIQGKVSLIGLLLFGAGGLAIIYSVAPYLDRIIKYVPSVWQYVLCILLSIVFAADIIFSLHRPNAGMGITF